MTKIANPQEKGAGLTKTITSPVNRRSFLKYAGAGAALSTLILVGCDKDDNDMDTSGVNLGSGDVGVLNYAYALEQLEAAFYTTVVASAAFATTFPNALERSVLTDIRDHEIAHRDFFKAAITAAAASDIIPGLTPDFSSINFNDRTAVLNAAKTFEDLGVAAYNGAGKLLVNPAYLTIAGKIVSVEARHAAEIRDIIENGTFASGAAGIVGGNLISAQGLDVALAPSVVLGAAQKYIKEKINGSNLPND